MTNNPNSTTFPSDEPKLTYLNFVLSLLKPGSEIYDQMTPYKANIWHIATGISGEAGELLDAVKKYVAYNKPLDLDNVVEELGDLEFYMQAMREAVGVTREQVIQQNMLKLSKRYNGSYSDKAAQERADKKEEEINRELQIESQKNLSKTVHPAMLCAECDSKVRLANSSYCKQCEDEMSNTEI